MRRQPEVSGETAFGVPFLATTFHATGLKNINPSERKREVLEVSTRAVRDIVASTWARLR